MFEKTNLGPKRTPKLVQNTVDTNRPKQGENPETSSSSDQKEQQDLQIHMFQHCQQNDDF